MRIRFPIPLLALASGLLPAQPVAESGRFALDLSYPALGISFPEAWKTFEVDAWSDAFSVRTKELLVDSDGDGLPDFYEVLHGLDPMVVDSGMDRDGDGRTNLQEYNAGTNPLVPDDWGKSIRGSNAFVVDTWVAHPEIVSNALVEVWSRSLRFLVSTANRTPDTDGDGIPDEWEIRFGLNPMVADSNLDGDGDGWSNLQEYNAGTNPRIFDDPSRARRESESFKTDTSIPYLGGHPIPDVTFVVAKVGGRFVCDTGGLYYDWDGDGIPNWWEARFSRSKIDLDAFADEDHDGATALQEFIAYTNPTNGLSVFSIDLESVGIPAPVASSPDGAVSGSPVLEPGLRISWPTANGRTYRLLTTTDLSGDWETNAFGVVEGTGETASIVVPQSEPVRFFRVTVELTPAE